MFSETDFGTTKINGVVEKCLLKAVEALDISRDDVSLAAICNHNVELFGRP